MASEGSDHLKAPETIPGEVQNKILALCGTAGMQPDQLLILHHVHETPRPYGRGLTASP